MSRDRVQALVEEAERSFRTAPKALWSDRTYLAPKDAKALREWLDADAHDTAERRRNPGIDQ